MSSSKISSSASAPTSRPVHPCILSVFDGSGCGGSCGVEYSTWAYVTSPRPPPSSSSNNNCVLPNLITAQSSTIRIYKIDDVNTGKLVLIHSFNNISGSVCYLETLHYGGGNSENGENGVDGGEYDSLLIGFSGHPRIAIVNVVLSCNTTINNNTNSLLFNDQQQVQHEPNLLLATSLIDLTPVLTEQSFGSVTPLEHDLIAKITEQQQTSRSCSSSEATLAIILGGGVAVAVVTLHRVRCASRSFNSNTPAMMAAEGEQQQQQKQRHGWYANEPYILPLSTLCKSINLDTPFGGSGSDLTASAAITTKDITHAHHQKGGGAAQQQQQQEKQQNITTSISHGFGDILSIQFLSRYSEPTICLLHSFTTDGGYVWSGRLGRSNGDEIGTKYGTIVTAISTTASQHRSAVLWSVKVPSDAIDLVVSGNVILVICINSIIHINSLGSIKYVLGLNGWCKSTLPTSLLHKVQCNPYPLPKLSIQLDGARISFLNNNNSSSSSSSSNTNTNNNNTPPPVTALVTLRCGQLYLLQRGTTTTTSSSSSKNYHHHHQKKRRQWGLMPLGQTFGTIGNIATLSSWPLSMPTVSPTSSLSSSSSSSNNLFFGGKNIHEKFKLEDNNKNNNEADADAEKKQQQQQQQLSMGLVFAGSRLGDSSLVGFVLESGISITATNEKEKGKEKQEQNEEEEGVSSSSKKRKREKEEKDEEEESNEENSSTVKKEDNDTDAPSTVTDDDDEYEKILQQEEDALYAPLTEADKNLQLPDIVPRSDDDDDYGEEDNEEEENANNVSSSTTTAKSSKKLDEITVVRSLIALDSITSLGPIGSGCVGSISRPNTNAIMTAAATTSATTTTTAQVLPCGFGSSGGLALVTTPGRDDRTIKAVADCLNAQCMFGLPRKGLVLLGFPRRHAAVSSSSTNTSTSTTTNGDDDHHNKSGVSVLRLQEQPSMTATNSKNATTMKIESYIDNSGGNEEDEMELGEVDLEEWCGGEESSDDKMDTEKEKEEKIWQSLYVLQQTTLISSAELNDDYFVVLAMEDQKEGENNNESSKYVTVVLREMDSKLQVVHVNRVGQQQQQQQQQKSVLLSATPMKQHTIDGRQSISFACTWSTGDATITTVQLLSSATSTDEKFNVLECILGDDTADQMIEDDYEDEEAQFYRSERIVAVDVFSAPHKIFTSSTETDHSATLAETVIGNGTHHTGNDAAALSNDASSPAGIEQYEFDEEDLELYGIDGSQQSTSAATSHSRATMDDTTNTNQEQKDELYVGVCRQSGRLQIYKLADFITSDSTNQHRSVWEVVGFGHGVPMLVNGMSIPPTPRMHKVCTAEFRFFFSGPSVNSDDDDDDKANISPTSLSEFRNLNVVLETNVGDVHLYTENKVGKQTKLTRVPLGVIARTSIQQKNHRTKLRRKNIVSRTAEEDDKAEVDMTALRHNRLHRFIGISGQDGLFAALARPIWLLSERGYPTFLVHRCKHVAPAGGKNRPVVGFCSGLLGDSGFLTLYERIGRVGSQRLTVFSGLSNVYSPHGMFPGSGLAAEKVPLGVTVRRIQFIDDASLSTNSHPLYVLLISSELEADKSELNDDGLSPEERQRVKDEKETEKVRKQVEADLGGFDVESEWVEEIERENCFDIDNSIGGAPPIQKCAYSLWLVDASDNWNVVDSYELGEFEHGLTMNVMPLTEVADETSAATADTIGENGDKDTLFIALGTGLVDNDGEDVSSRGRVLLFEVKRAQSLSAGQPVAELSLKYEKDMLHGPVQTLSCLTCEGRSRLIIGAGADVNVEQWGNGKLTQVGFFRADMHILDIMLFKNFFLLSDAYDSLYFLVWRESDKSLTLLAKDYEPIPVYSSGLISRGGSVSLVCTDDRQNIQFFQYAPGESASRGGNKLVARSDFHLGSQTVGIMENHYCRSSLTINSATPASTLAALKQQDTRVGRTDDDQRLGAYFGSTDGMFKAVIPLSEPIYWRLTALQAVITNALESNCSLSPKAFRLYRRTPKRGGCRSNDRKKNVIDGDLVGKYVDLPLSEQENLALSIGTTVDSLLDNLLELKCSSMVI